MVGPANIPHEARLKLKWLYAIARALKKPDFRGKYRRIREKTWKIERGRPFRSERKVKAVVKRLLLELGQHQTETRECPGNRTASAHYSPTPAADRRRSRKCAPERSPGASHCSYRGRCRFASGCSRTVHRRAASREACTAGSTRPINNPMIAITTMSSINVKPRTPVGILFHHTTPSFANVKCRNL